LINDESAAAASVLVWGDGHDSMHSTNLAETTTLHIILKAARMKRMRRASWETYDDLVMVYVAGLNNLYVQRPYYLVFETFGWGP
jgi:hypothetical protein